VFPSPYQTESWRVAQRFAKAEDRDRALKDMRQRFSRFNIELRPTTLED
jgi:hypothetical protein